jgi:L-lactate dehydrogenase complex protein LldE
MAEPHVALFATCLADQLFPEVAKASVHLLRHLGVRVSFPMGQTCCGQPAYNAGYHAEARDVARHHLDVFQGFDYVVLPSGSCGAMVARHYPELFEEDPGSLRRAEDLAGRIFELTTFISEKLGFNDVGSDLSGLRVAYHDSCHAMRSLGVREAPRTLLRAAGAEVVDDHANENCCGFGGLFSVKMPDISSAMARTRLETVEESSPQVLTSTDAGCLMQLQGALL